MGLTRTLCGGLIAAVLVAGGHTAAATPTAPPYPGDSLRVGPAGLPSQIEAFADYEGQSLCMPAAKAGTQRLARLLTRRFGGYGVSIARGCDVGGTSEHKEGRALDWMVSRRVPAQRRQAQAFLDWLLAADAAGNPAAMARRLGVMYIGWDNRIWRAYDDGTWGELHGCLSRPERRRPAYDSTCHRNHVHVSLSWDGATARTSYWTGRVLPPPCEAGWGADPEVGVPESGETVIVDTGAGIGTPDALPCRLGAPRWRGDERALSVRLVDPAATVPTDPAPDWTGPDPGSTDGDGPTWDGEEPSLDDPGWTEDPATAEPPATVSPEPVAYDVRLRVDRLSGNAPGRLLLGIGPVGSLVRVEPGTPLPRTVTVRVGPDRTLVTRVSVGLAAVRLTVLGVTPVLP